MIHVNNTCNVSVDGYNGRSNWCIMLGCNLCGDDIDVEVDE